MYCTYSSGHLCFPSMFRLIREVLYEVRGDAKTFHGKEKQDYAMDIRVQKMALEVRIKITIAFDRFEFLLCTDAPGRKLSTA